MRRLKLTLIRQWISSTRLQRIFLSQAGPRFDLELFQAEHHLLFDVVWSPPTKKATRFGSPSSGLLSAARDLAQGAPSEGYDVTGPANLIGAMQARQSGDGGRRFGEECLGVGFDQHRVVASAGSQDRASIGHWQEFQTKI
jgi:hypothetical protein